MEYIQLFWGDAPEGEPPVILYEVDTEDERLAHRSIDVFPDRTCKRIEDLYQGAIEIVPIPPAEEFNAQLWGEEFRACAVSQQVFEEIWDTLSYTGPLQWPPDSL